jgi:hypothetical protein
MSTLRSLTFTAAFFFTLSTAGQPTAAAQQSTANSGSPAQDKQAQIRAHNGGMPSVEDHLKFLSQALELTEDQQDQARPILRGMQDSMIKLNQDESLTREQRREQRETVHNQADQKLRQFLSDDQKKKLDQLEQRSHPEPHGEMK